MKPIAKPKPKPKHRSKYTDEFKAGALRLIAEGRSPASIAADLGVHSSSVYNWVNRAAVDAGTGDVGKLSTDERAELTTLRKANRVLKMEREIVNKAAAFFAKENA